MPVILTHAPAAKLQCTKPSGAANAPASDTATADSGQGKKEGEAPKPHKDFILDGLLR